MRRLLPGSLGLIGQIVAILLVTMVIEFGASTFLYERAAQFSARDDEARRLAEHLTVARNLLAERPRSERAAMASDVSTQRYLIEWRDAAPRRSLAPSLDTMYAQVVAWEPSLASRGLRIRAVGAGRGSLVNGEMQLGDGSWLSFRTLRPLNDLDLRSERVVLALVPAIALMILGWLLVRRTLTPIRQLSAAADRFGQGEHRPVEEAGPAEVRHLVVAFNAMQARIERLITDRTQALAAVGHDLRTPLARLRLRSDGIVDPDTRDAIDRDLGEMEEMLGSLMAYLGGDSDPEKPVLTDVAVICATLIDDVEDRGGAGVYVGPDHVETVVRPSALKRALTNLVDNAMHYAGNVALTLRTDDDRIVITIEDDGPGIPEGSLKHVLEPFVRLEASRPRDTIGVGLGLPIVVRIVDAEGGTMSLANRPTGGLSVRLVLPYRNT